MTTENKNEISFDDLKERANLGEDAQLGALAYEDRAVRRLLTLVNQPRLITQISQEARARVETSQCNFALLDELTGFPIRCGIGKLKAIHHIAIPDLYGRFAKLPMAMALAQLADDYDPRDGPIALIFRWGSQAQTGSGKSKGIVGGAYMAIHTSDHHPTLGDAQIVSTLKLRKRTWTVRMEPMASMLAPYANWEPVY